MCGSSSSRRDAKASGSTAPRARSTAVVLVVAVFAAFAGLTGLNGLAEPAVAAGVAPDGAPVGVDAPAGAIGQVGPFLVDGEGRALLPHGVSLPATQAATDDELDAWVRAGLSAVRLVVPVAADGSLPDLGEPPALDALLAAVERYTDRGFWVVARLSPARTGSELTQPATEAAIVAVSTALREAAGLIGYEVAVPASVDEAALAAALRRNDPHRALWRELPASIDPAATVAVAGEAAYLVSWGNGTVATTRRIAAAAEAAPMGWFYDLATIGAVLTEVVRPYPVAVAGTPTELAATADGSFTLTYSTEPPAGSGLAPGAASAVVLPATLYPNGYTATVTGGQVTSAPGAPVLCVVAAAGVTSVSVAVSAATGGAQAAVPVAAATTATSCAAPSAPAAGGVATPEAGGVGSADGSTGAASDVGLAAEEGDDLALLVLFPLIGAVAAALLLAPVMMLLRPRRQASGTASGTASGAAPGAD